jgi:hypothetical protein
LKRQEVSAADGCGGRSIVGGIPGLIEEVDRLHGQPLIKILPIRKCYGRPKVARAEGVLSALVEEELPRARAVTPPWAKGLRAVAGPPLKEGCHSRVEFPSGYM